MRSRPSAIFQRQSGGGGSPPPADIVVGGAQTSANTGGGTTLTVSLPSYVAGDYLLLIVAGNQTSSSFTPDANATLTSVANVDTGRLAALKVTPVGSPTSFVLTFSATRVSSAVVLNLGQITPTFTSASNPIGTNTTSAIAVPNVTVSSTDGHELQIVAACVNSSAAWTAPSSPTLSQHAALTVAPGLYVGSVSLGVGVTSVTCSDVDRGNGGTNRNETVLHLVVDS